MLTHLLTTTLQGASDPLPEPQDFPSYGSDAGFSAWLTANGYSLPAGTPPLSVLRARATIYVDGYETRWTGARAGGVMQELGWPRIGATINCAVLVPADATPPAVVAATYRAAWLEASSPGVLSGPIAIAGKRVKRNKVEGAVEREYFDDGKAQMGGGPTFIDSQIDGLLGQFICEQKSGAFIWALGS